MKFVKLFENYFRDKKELMSKIDDIHYKISDIQLSFKDQLLDDLADVSDIPNVKIYPLMTIQDEIALNPEDELEGEYPNDEVYIEIDFKFENVVNILNNLRNFEKRYINDYSVLYTLNPNINIGSNDILVRHSDEFSNICFNRKENIISIIDSFKKDIVSKFNIVIDNNILKSGFKPSWGYDSNLIITLKEK
jgi:hypothetical protein